MQDTVFPVNWILPYLVFLCLHYDMPLGVFFPNRIYQKKKAAKENGQYNNVAPVF